MADTPGDGCSARIFPFGFWGEFKELCRLALPIMLTALATNTIGTVSIVFSGHLGKSQLAAVGLANSVFNVTGLAVMYGLLTACDTLFSQTFGGKNKHAMGIQLQRGLYIIVFCCFPCWGLHLVMEPILLAMGQDPMVSRDTGHYLVFTLPALLFAAVYNLLTKYVQTQNIVYPPLIIGVIGNGTNALLHFFLLYRAGWGLTGSAISQSFSYFFECLLMIIYLVVSKVYTATWNGYQSQMWADWGIWFKLAFPGLMMLGLQWWIFEIGTICSGLVGSNTLGAQTILLTIDSLIFTLIPLGLGIGACIRVGQALGSGNSMAPKSTVSVSLVTLCVGSMLVSILLVSFRWHIPNVFTSDEEIVTIAAQTIPLVAVFILFDGVTGVLGGVLRGTGMQKTGAGIVFISFYLITGPIGLSLLLKSHLKLIGLWIGFVIGIATAAMTYLVICFRIDWEEQVELAAKRTAIPLVDFVEDNDESKSKTFSHQILFSISMFSICLLGLILKLAVSWETIFGSFCIMENSSYIRIHPADKQDLTAFAISHNCSIYSP